MTQNHQDITISVKIMLLTAMFIDTTDLSYPYISGVMDEIIRKILPVVDIHEIKNIINPKCFLMPEKYLEKSSDNAIILEWWKRQTANQSEIGVTAATVNPDTNQQIEYRFSYYQGSEGLSMIIDRGALSPVEIALNLDERDRIISNLVEFLQ